MSKLRIVSVSDLGAAAGAGSSFDAVVVVAPSISEAGLPATLQAAIDAHLAADARAATHRVLIASPDAAGGRIVLAPTGPVGRDMDDVRRFADAARGGVLRARDAGSVRPLLVVSGVPGDDALFAQALPVTALGAVAGLWQPLEAMESGDPATLEPIQELGVAQVGSGGGSFGEGAARWADAVEAGLRIARDLCGTEPERMAPPRFADYCVEAFADLDVKVEVVSDGATIVRDYPLAAAVARSSMQVERHRPRIVRLEYVGSGPIDRTIMIAGKGVCYDTGGADLKVGGHMAGMSRDKGGAAATAGFVAAVARLAPAGVRVVAEIGCVRNSIGAEAYVADEIITSHAGVRVRIGNTDAEGRMVLADLLSHLRIRAKDCENPVLMTIATLTGHAVRAAGPYTIALDNEPARQAGVAASLGAVGDVWGDPVEISRLRREDWNLVKSRSKADDVLQCNNAPSTGTNRGHQFPMAFLAIASGLDAHGKGAAQPLPFTHIDIAGSACVDDDWQHGQPTGRPIVAMLAALVGAQGLPQG